jgi:hypothetical protein
MPYSSNDMPQQKVIVPGESGGGERVKHYVRLCLKSALLRKVALYCRRLLISRTQSSSFPGPAPSPCASRAGSEIEDLLMQGIGCNDAPTVTDSPGFKIWETCPSMDTPAGARLRSPIYKVTVNGVDRVREPRKTI